MTAPSRPALTPTTHLTRAAAAFAGRTAVVDGRVVLTYAELAARCAGLAEGLRHEGVRRGDRVAALCANSHVMLELHHAVPALGAVLVPMNVRLGEDEMVYVLEHSGAEVLVATRELAARADALAHRLGLRVVHEGDDYESLLRPGATWPVATADGAPLTESDLLSVNYTSGTTGRPKGVMYHHRGAHLQSLAMAFHTRLEPRSVYLWTLPMFHCHGWSFPWAVTAAGGAQLCLRSIETTTIWRHLRDDGVTHLSAAPTVLSMIAEDPDAAPLPAAVHVDTGGAPPSPTLLSRLHGLGMTVTHLYGLTETFGPVAVNVWQPEWDALPEAESSRLRARQGIANIAADALRVIDTEGRDVAPDGATVGEIAVLGNAVMSGYYRDEAATEAVVRDGCLLTGDLGVMHPDGYVEIRDRAKDVIISGGENIASIEVEQALASHPDVVECAVVGASDERWGEVPVAFVTLRDGAIATEQALRDHVRERLAGFKVPRRVVFADLPRTSTGKIQKNVLRDLA